jgi:branched-chain amino acid transport system substrate-binding protein
MGINFIKQMNQAGLMTKMPLYSVFTVDGTTLPALREAAVGSLSGAMWDAALDTPDNKKFVSDFERKYKRTPSEYAATAYDAANILNIALGKAKAGDSKSLAAAVKAAGSEVKSVRGPFAFNNNNLPIQNYYAFETVKSGGKIVGQMVATPLVKQSDAYHGQCGLK